MKKLNQLLLNLIKKLARPFIGKGFIYKNVPFLVSFYENLYSTLQPDEIVLTHLDNASFKVFQKDTHVGMMLLEKGEFEPIQTSLLLESLQESQESQNSPVFFDIGANVGYYSFLFGNKYPKSKIYSFEPNNRVFEVLMENLKNNPEAKVENIAVGATEGVIGLKENIGHLGKSQIAKEDYSYEVPMTTLDSYCLKNSIFQIDILKIDVEGYELFVLEGAKNIISTSPNLRLFIEFNPETLSEINKTRAQFFDEVGALGFTPIYIADEIGKQVLDYSPQSLDNVLKKATYTNLMFTK